MSIMSKRWIFVLVDKLPAIIEAAISIYSISKNPSTEKNVSCVIHEKLLNMYKPECWLV